MKIREKLEYYETTNRGLFNKYYRKECRGCSICGWHTGCNSDHKSYGGYSGSDGESRIKYPSWKLVSKKRKQWMEKPKSYEIKRNERLFSWYNTYYIEIKF